MSTDVKLLDPGCVSVISPPSVGSSGGAEGAALQ
jgi:hypothetical protein